MTLDDLHRAGFDQSAKIFGLSNRLAVKCSQCQSVVVNGVPIHEEGCPNEAKAKRAARAAEERDDESEEG